jgi:beta-glucosidase
VMRELGALISYVCTINEANIAIVLQQLGVAIPPRGDDAAAPQAPIGVGGDPAHGAAGVAGWLAASARELNTTPERLKPFIFADAAETQATIMEAHVRARDAIKAVRAETRVGLTLALHDVQVLPGGEARAAAVVDEAFRSFLPACAGDDFLGVQNYSRQRVGPEGILPNEAGVETTQMGYEYYPEALAGALRLAAVAGLPMIVTENGLSTEDDARRVEFIDRALAGVERCLAEGLDVRGYLYWSALDNFEWVFGYGPKFGLIAVDRATQERHVKESARHLGRIARTNATAG